MKKRIVALLLAATQLIGLLSGCKRPGSSLSGEQSNQGEMLSTICDEFGMYTHSEAAPYFSSVSSSSQYYDAAQACAEWDVIDAQNSDFDPNAPLTRGELAVAVVNAANLTALNAPDEEKLSIAKELGIIESDGNGKINTKQRVSQEEMTATVQRAASVWQNKTFSQKVEKLELAPNVKDFRDSVGQWSENCIYLPISAGEVVAGDSFIYNSGDGYRVAKASSVEIQGDQYVIVENGEELDPEDFIADLQVQNTFTPDLKNSTFMDANGDIHNLSAQIQANQNSYVATPLVNCGKADLYNLSSATSKFKVNGITIELEASDDGSISVKLEKECEDGKLSGSVKLSDISLTAEINGLKSALCKIDYKLTIGGGYKQDLIDQVYAPYNNGNGHFLSNLKRSSWKDADEKGADYIKVGSWTLQDSWLEQIRLELQVQFKVTGEISVQLVLSGAKGLEYRKGNVRIIKESSKDVDLSAKCKASITANLGLTLSAFHRWELFGFWVKGGLGAEAKATVHLIDTDRHLLETYEGNDMNLANVEAGDSLQFRSSARAVVKAAEEQGCPNYSLPSPEVLLNTETCIDINVYGILELSAEPGKWLKKQKWMPWKGSTINILGKDNCSFLQGHIENWDFLHPTESCTKKYTDFDHSGDEEPNAETHDWDRIDLDSYLLVLTDAPKSLTVSFSGSSVPVVWSSENPSVARVDQHGMVTPIGPGATIVSVTLESDPMVSIKCSVYIQEPEDKHPNWEFLPATMSWT